MLLPSLALLPLAALSVWAHAAPPNPDQLFALQEAAASKASLASASTHSHTHKDPIPTGNPPQIVRPHHGDGKHSHHANANANESAVKRHLRQGGRMHNGMQRVKRGAGQRLSKPEEVREKLRERERRDSGLDSSSSAEEGEGEHESDLEARQQQQIPLDGAESTSPANATAQATNTQSRKVEGAKATQQAASHYSGDGGMGSYWSGVSSYYLYALADSERYQVLDAIKSGGFKVVRIFVAYVGHNNKGSNNAEVNDLEPGAVGTYDDTVLLKIDQLMVDCKERGLKLMIALSDRYALGYWSTDAYALQLNIVKAGSSGVQRIADASNFYTNSWAAGAFDKRLQHALTHKNNLMGGKTWAELDEVVYAYEPQNEPQGHMPMVSGTWACDRAAYLKSLIKGNILVGSGGGITIDTSLAGWATTCASFDIISVHDYGTNGQGAANALIAAKNGAAKGKIVMMGEWGITGANKASTIKSFVDAFKAAGLPWMYWEVVKPGKAASDFEVWTDEPAWGALTGGPFDSTPQYVPETKKPVAPATTKATQWSASSAAWTPSKSATQEWKPAPSSSQWQAPASAKKDDDKKDDWKPASSAPAQQTKASWTPAASPQAQSSPNAAVSAKPSRAVKTDN